MGLLARLSALISRPRPVSAPPARHATTAAQGLDSAEENALRERLHADPNDSGAFAELAELVRRRADATAPADPLTAGVEPADRQVAADVAIWALAEELAGNPRAWYPLVALGRLSLAEDHEGAIRRFATACEREESGLALAESVRTLREAGQPGDGLGLGVAHWVPAEHVPEAARQIVLAAVDADRPADARRHLRDLAEVAGAHSEFVAELEPAVAAAEASAAG